MTMRTKCCICAANKAIVVISQQKGFRNGKVGKIQGGCLCGAIRFEAAGPAEKPHSCSCKQCQRHTGSLTALWVEFAAKDVSWTGPGGKPATYRSSDNSSRAFCPTCGSSLGAIDDAPVVALLLGTFDSNNRAELAPDYHSYISKRPDGGNLHYRKEPADLDKRDISGEFRKRLATLVERSGLNQSAFAARAGIDRSALSQLLSGASTRLPRSETLANIASIGGVTIDWLLGLTAREGQTANCAPRWKSAKGRTTRTKPR